MTDEIDIDMKAGDEQVAEAIKQMEAAEIEARDADIAVIEAREKMAEYNKSAEEKALDKAIAEAETKRAKVAELQMAARGAAPMSVGDAKIMAPVPGNMSAAAHMAQKFGNDPANPKVRVHVANEPASVLLTRKSPDHNDPIEAMVHPDMVGDYERAGWNKG